MAGVLLAAVVSVAAWFYAQEGSALHKRAPRCLMDNEVLADFCLRAVRDEQLFERFRKAPWARLFFEPESAEQGWAALEGLSPVYRERLEACREADAFGAPRLFDYGPFGNFSPATLCAIETASRVQGLFGSLSGKRVLEIGGGFGTQCRVFAALEGFASYTIVDLPEVLALAKKCLRDVPNVRFATVDEVDGAYDLVISRYGFCEYDRMWQQRLMDSLFPSIPNGYLACRFYPKHFYKILTFTREELIRKFPYAECLPARPPMGQQDVILVWRKP
jgi:hypothetical protein